MEYIHTYGWIILSVIMIGGVALYFNVSRAQYLIPLECSFLSGISCLDAVPEETTLTFSLVNELGFAISNITMNVTGTCNSSANTTDGNSYGNLNVLLANQQAIYILDCQNLTNMRVEEVISFGYVSVDSGQGHVKVGKLQFSPTGQ
jgi:hypothetical protein